MFFLQTGQIDLAGLKEYFLNPKDTSLSGSSSNTSGFYPYTGNPAQFISTGDVHTISGHISGYIDSVSGALRTNLGQTGVSLSGYTSSVASELKTDVTNISGDIREVSGDLRQISGLAVENQADIDLISGNLITSGENLSVLITGASGDGVSGFVTGFVHHTSGELNTKINNLDVSLKSHVSSDYVSRKDIAEGNLGISGRVHFEKTPHFNKGLYVDKVTTEASVSAIQSGSVMYNIVTGHQEGGTQYDVMTNYIRMPHSGQSDPYENIIVNSLMYKASDNIIT